MRFKLPGWAQIALPRRMVAGVCFCVVVVMDFYGKLEA
jgi:hypothetical protein